MCYRQSGWSLWPRVRSNDLCTYEPVTDERRVQEQDIVFCEVQPYNRFYVHLVNKKEWDFDHSQYKFTITNIKGRENGYCFMRHIYGRLIACEQ